MAQAKIALHPRAPKIEVTILESKIFVDGFLGVHLEWRHRRAIENFELPDRDLDVAGRKTRVLRARRTPADRTADAHDVFVSQMLGLRETGVLRMEDDLRDAFVISQIDENQAPVIPAPVYPAVQFNRRPFVSARVAPRTKLYRSQRASFIPET